MILREIDTSGWGEFRVGDLFDVVKGSRLRSVDRVDGEIPYIGATLFGNGYVQTIGNDESLHPGGVLTACYNGRATGVTFYQPERFWATDDVNVLYPKFEMSEEIGLFIAPVIQSVGINFGWESKWNLPDMIGAVIRLPVTAAGDPDWDLMESVMLDAIAKREAALDALLVVGTVPPRVVDTSGWGDFRVGELFEVINGRKYPMTWRVPGEIPLVSTSAVGNGLSDAVGFPEGSDYETHSNLLTIAYSGSVGSTFYHSGEVFVGETVMGLLPRDGVRLNEATGVYLASVIRSVMRDYSYDNKVKVSDVRDRVSIKLPATAAGDPDWDLMESVMLDVMAEREAVLDALLILTED